ncbi:hypothetical protein K5X82_11620 [Halosquirtibacter xylanolyticus]|uniref:hypothetical protein n=1 Tax=Halosquirtibacter xylanolyticus TaxID=3374599 RepID=UPI003747B397|nr:hypothetical protein K5X82_11620 [Prolixibacteraceae bacterium]
MTKCIKKIAAITSRIFILGMLLWMQMLSIVTMHSHTLDNGEVIWHFHPLSSPDQSGTNGHQHNNCTNYHGFSWQSITWLLADKPIVPPDTIHIQSINKCDQIDRIVLTECPSIRLRGPPSLS